VTSPVPGPPASVLSAVLRANSAHPYNASDPTQLGRGIFTTASNLPFLPSLMTEVVFLPEFAFLDANILASGYLSTQGLAGATAASRYVGATTSGAPASGTFAVGDFVLDQTGSWWICTVAGSPGTWVGAGNNNAYDQAVTADSPTAWWKLADASGSGTAADASGNSHTGTATNVTFGYPGPVSVNASETAGFFNASSSTITSSYNPSGAAISIELWLNATVAQLTAQPRVVANSHTDADNKGFQFQLTTASSLLTPKIGFGNGTTTAAISGTYPVAASVGPSNGWVHLVATYDSTTMRLYVNRIQSQSGTGLSGSVAAGSNGISIGYNATYGGDFWGGSLAQVAIYTTALSAPRVLAHYQAAVYS
jgi:Concanavalin A-like lectin/glucanases superfamily